MEKNIFNNALSKLSFSFVWLAVFFTLIVLTGCEKDEKNIKSEIAKEKGEYTIYYKDENQNMYSYVYKSSVTDSDKLIQELIDELKKGDYERCKDPVISKELADLSVERNSRNVIRMSFPKMYSNLEGISEAIFRACVVKTICQIDKDVVGVEFYIDDLPLAINNGHVVIYDESKDINEYKQYIIGVMNQYDFVDSISVSNDNFQKDVLTLYFSDETGKKLVPTYVEITYKDEVSMEQLAVLELIDGPSSDGIYKCVNENTIINKIYTKDSTCYLDLSRDFLDIPDDVTKDVSIYSIVNSLLDLNNVARVQLYIDGEIYNEYNNEGIFERNYNLINGEE